MQANLSDAYCAETVWREPNRKRHILSSGKFCRKALHFLVLVRDVSYGEAVKMHSEIVSQLTKNVHLYDVQGRKSTLAAMCGQVSSAF